MPPILREELREMWNETVKEGAAKKAADREFLQGWERVKALAVLPALQEGADFLAKEANLEACVNHRDGGVELAVGIDRRQEPSYFLAFIPDEGRRRVNFTASGTISGATYSLGALTEEKIRAAVVALVRQIARRRSGL